MDLRTLTTYSAQQEGSVGAVAREQTSAALIHPTPDPKTWSSPTLQTTTTFYQYSSEPTLSCSLPILHPHSPPPTYAATVSTVPALDSTRSQHHPHVPTHHSIAACQSGDRNNESFPGNDNHSAYRIGLGDMQISELAGDTISFSATNSAGPVNPYELCAKLTEENRAISHMPQVPSEVLAEMLGDIHFPLELPSNEPVLPHDCPPWQRTRFEHAGLTQPRHNQLRKRAAPEESSVVHRRPVPMGALNDSLPMVHELPPSFGLSAASRVVGNPEFTVNPSDSGAFAVKISSQNSSRSGPHNRPFTYTAHGSNSGTASGLIPIARCSKLPPMQPVFSQQAAAFSADSTSSWGLDTQPKAPKAPAASEPATSTRMKSQKQILDLLGSI